MAKENENKARPPKAALKTATKSVASVKSIDVALEEFIHRGEKKQRPVPSAESATTHSVSNARSYGRPPQIEVE